MWKRKQATGHHEAVCKWKHRECICLKCRHDDKFCCEFHGKACNGKCAEFEAEQKDR